MKKINFHLIIWMLALSTWGCAKKDNYDLPKETLTGRIIDQSTGQPLQSDGTTIRLEELSWAAKNGTTVQPQDIRVKADGTFNNSKLFAGNYRIYPFQGPYVPVYSTDAANPIDNSKTLDIKGVTTVDFNVEPFLKVEWIGEPVLNADKTVTVQFKFTRGTANPNFMFNVTDAWLFIGETALVGNGSRNAALSNSVTYNGTAGNDKLDQVVSLTSKAPLGTSRTYYLRIGARTNDNIQKAYNYTAPKPITVQ
jgi:hypothetical protein